MHKTSTDGLVKIKFGTLVPILLLLSCDCYRTAEGIIIDADSDLPVKNVQIVNDRDFELKQTDHLETSNEEGRFSYSDISGGLFGCPDLVLVFSKLDFSLLIRRTPRNA